MIENSNKGRANSDLKETFYITTPIYYPSDKLHIGHSYCTVSSDAIARYKRLKGYDVMFLTGTDEHGQKIQERAQEKGVTPKEYVDKIVKGILDLWKLMKISNDRFIRTTDENHKRIVQGIFQKLYDKGDIYKSEYEGWYCTPCESFWTKTQLVDGKCPDCNREVKLTKEESYFFRLSKYQNRLIKYIEENPNFITPITRQNEMLNNFLKQGLEDIAVSRTSFNWGVPVPFDNKHVIYVWIDALSNYITALGYSDPDDSSFKKFWPADVRVVGKEITRFHTIIWPAMLMALDLPLPKQIFGHGWMLIDGGKMSKSKGNVVDPVVLVEKYRLDAIRYYLLREVPFGSDGIFTTEALITRINSDLANDFGNLLSRTVAMIEKYFSGKLPQEMQDGEHDEELKAVVIEASKKVDEWMDKYQFSQALGEIWKAISRANKYIDETMPWALAKDEAKKPRLAKVLYNLAETLRIVSVLLEPFMTDAPGKIRYQLGVDAVEHSTWESAKSWGIYSTACSTSRGDVIFPRIDMALELAGDETKESASDGNKETKKDNEKKQEKSASKPESNQSPKEQISIDDFAKIDLRTAVVVEASKVEGADKLLKLILDLGNEKRQVVSGIAKQYSPESLVGKQVIVVANLKPVKLRGIESHGMILCASNGDKLILGTVETSCEPGSEVR